MDVGESRSNDRVCDSQFCSLGSGIWNGLGQEPRLDDSNAARPGANGRNGGDRNGRWGWPFADFRIGVVSESGTMRRCSERQSRANFSNAGWRHVHTVVGVKEASFELASRTC